MPHSIDMNVSSPQRAVKDEPMEEEDAVIPDVAKPAEDDDVEMEQTQDTVAVSAGKGDEDIKKNVKLEDLFDDEDDLGIEVDDSIFTPTSVHSHTISHKITSS
jgi:hypothetical protein